MSVDKYFSRRYDPATYNCLHFSVEVWRDLTGEDISERLSGLLAGELSSRTVQRATRRGFRVVEPEPNHACLVIMQRPKVAPHIGVWLRGRILHIQSRSGVQFTRAHVATFGFHRVRYFIPS